MPGSSAPSSNPSKCGARHGAVRELSGAAQPPARAYIDWSPAITELPGVPGILHGATARRKLRDVWDQMADTPAAVVWAIRVSLDQSGHGANAGGGRRGLHRAGGRESGP